MKNIITPLIVSLVGGSILMIFLTICLFPFLAIWGINTLFPHAALDYSFWNWLAIIALKLVFSSSSTVKVNTQNTARGR